MTGSNKVKPMRTLAIALALCMALPGAATAAQGELPRELPAYGEDKPLPVPRIEKKTLANGLEVWVVPRDGMPRVDYVLAVRNAGYVADAADAPGFASLFAGLLAQGTASRDSRAIAETAQSYGGSVGASASNDGVLVQADALTRHAAPMLGLLAEVVRSPSFPDAEVRLAQANALQGLKAAEAQPSFKATRALLAATYGDHPYARVQQTEASISAVTPAALRQAHALRFHPDRALLVVTGRVEPAEAFRLAEESFGDWQVAGAEAPETPAAPQQVAPSHVLIQREGSVQSTLRLGRPAIAATHPDYVPAILAGTVLGGGFSSRVNQNLREDKGYTYGASAGFSPARMGGRVQAGADVRNEVTGAALQEFFSEFRRLADEPVPEQELLDTKRYVAGGYLISNQLQGAVAATLASNWLVGLPAEFLASYVPKVREVDAAQVQAIARKYFDPKDQSIIVVGDGGAIAGQLEPYGEFRIVE
jgi:zinc protease